MASCVKSIFAFEFFFLFIHLQIFAIEKKLSESDSICVIASQRDVSDEWMRAIVNQLKESFPNGCDRRLDPMEDPFSEAAQSFWKESSTSNVIGFWLGSEGGDRTILIRGFDLQTGWEWGVRRLPTHSLGSAGIVSLAQALVQDLWDQYPSVGIIDKGRVYCWMPKVSVRVKAVLRADTIRHPFRMGTLGMKWKELPFKEAVLKRDSSDICFVSNGIGNDSKDRIWLLPANPLQN